MKATEEEINGLGFVLFIILLLQTIILGVTIGILISLSEVLL